MTQERLAGGNMGPVWRRGERVVRPAGDWTAAVHRLLDHLEAAGVAGVPRARGRLADGREALTYVEGIVPSYPMPAWVWGEPALVSSARLLRVLHDATRGFTDSGGWRSPTHQPVDVICHNDFAPYNLVFQEGRAVGVIDFDFASPGPRLWDVAYLAYRIVPLTTAEVGDGFSTAQRSGRLDALLEAYGMSCSRGEFRAVLAARLAELADFSEAMAEVTGNDELRDHAELYRRDASAPVVGLD